MIQRYLGDRYAGISSDIKPAGNLSDGAEFFETDTLDAYVFISASGGWVLENSGGTGSSGATGAFLTSGDTSKNIILCASFTPSSLGSDETEIPIPFDVDGVTPMDWIVKRATLRLQTAGGSPSISLQKSASVGVFSYTNVTTLTMPVGAYETYQTGDIGQLTSNEKIRFSVNDLGSALNWCFEIQMTPGSLPAVGQGSDMPLDAAVYHPSRNSLFAVRAGYIAEYDLNLNLLNRRKFVNPAFSKSCIAYDTANDKLWVGTQGSWALGRDGSLGKTGIGSHLGTGQGQTNSWLEPKSTADLYKINPSSLALESNYDFTAHEIYGLGRSPSESECLSFSNPEAGFYDLIYVTGRLYGCVGDHDFSSNKNGLLTLNANDLTESGIYYNWNEVPSTQCAYENGSSRAKVWFAQQTSAYWANWPAATTDTFEDAFNNFDSPYPTYFLGVSGSQGAIAYSPIGTGAMYLVQVNNAGLIKYNISGSIIAAPMFPSGIGVGGMTVRLRFNTGNNYLYIPCPALDMIIEYNPATDTYVRNYSGSFDCPHDIVFTPGHAYAIQYGISGLKQIF